MNQTCSEHIVIEKKATQNGDVLIVMNQLFMQKALGVRERGVGGSVDTVILGCQASELLSEQGGCVCVTKNCSEGLGEHSGTETATEGVGGIIEATSKMASKGKNTRKNVNICFLLGAVVQTGLFSTGQVSIERMVDKWCRKD